MKFYTLEWFRGDRDSDNLGDTAARSYFQALKPRLTDSMRAFIDAVNLHDAHLERLDFSTEHAGLTLVFDELFWDFARNCGSRRPLFIKYGSVSAFSLLPFTQAVTVRHSPPHDDLLGDEIDVFAEGIFEHRMVFASGTELHIRFQNFSFSNQATGDFL